LSSESDEDGRHLFTTSLFETKASLRQEELLARSTALLSRATPGTFGEFQTSGYMRYSFLYFTAVKGC